MQELQSPFENYLEGLRTKATRANYRWGITQVLGDRPDEFLALARKDREKAETRIISYIRSNRERVASATVINPVMAVKSFLEYYEVPINWRKIRRELPVHQKVALDRGPSLEEIRKLLSVCDLRMRAVEKSQAPSPWENQGPNHLSGLAGSVVLGPIPGPNHRDCRGLALSSLGLLTLQCSVVFYSRRTQGT